jgi:hypothetical protein
MMKLDNLPNRIDGNDLGGAPHAADADFWWDGREASTYFVVWPAHDGERHINIRISTEELSRLSGVPFAIDTRKINAALQQYRPLIERRVNELLRADTKEIVLDLGSLVTA